MTLMAPVTNYGSSANERFPVMTKRRLYQRRPIVDFVIGIRYDRSHPTDLATVGFSTRADTGDIP